MKRPDKVAMANERLLRELDEVKKLRAALLEAGQHQAATSGILQSISRSPSDVQPVFDSIAANARRLCQGHFCAVFRFDGELIHLAGHDGLSSEGSAAYRQGFPIRPGMNSAMGRAILGRDVAHIPDVHADPEYGMLGLARAITFRAVVAVPMLQSGRPVGGIAVLRSDAGFFSDNEIALLRTFADQAVIAIENVRLFKELHSRSEALARSVEQLTALGEMGQAISSTLDVDTVLKTIVSHAIQLSGLDAGLIYEYDESSREFHLRASENLDEESIAGLRGAGLREGEGAAGTSVVTGEPTQVPDTHASGYPARLRALLEHAGVRAILAVPLLREEQILGALMVMRKTPGPFVPEIVGLLRTFSAQSALAIQNARLFREIAEKSKQLEAASRHKSNFLASMSHELRTPLNAILGFNEMILGEIYGEVPAEMKEPLSDIQASGKHLLRLINNVLDLAKIEAGRMELALSEYSVHDTVERVRSTLRPLAADKGLEFLATVAPEMPLAYGDSGRITQCLMNLAGNSLKFTRAGKVEISVECRGEHLVYRVADTGVGIAPDKIAQLFAEFRQTDATIASEYGGTGLGLSISRKFVELHGGRIWAESALGEGSAFIFEIPLRVSTEAPA